MRNCATITATTFLHPKVAEWEGVVQKAEKY